MLSREFDVSLIAAAAAAAAAVASAGWSVAGWRRVGRLERDLGELSRSLRLQQARLGTRGQGRSGSEAVARVPDSPHGSQPPQPVWPREPDRVSNEHAALITVPDLGLAGAGCPEESVEGLRHRHAELWAMAEAGTPPTEIARRTGQPIGRVELVLGLHRSLRQRGGASDDERSS
jgi:hypothetical protein